MHCRRGKMKRKGQNLGIRKTARLDDLSVMSNIHAGAAVRTSVHLVSAKPSWWKMQMTTSEKAPANHTKTCRRVRDIPHAP
jgi:hypothetical protein